MDSTTSSVAMTGAGATFDLGAVQQSNVPPVADPGGPYSGTEGSPIAFDGSGSTGGCGSAALHWTFSDGGEASGVNPQHTFTDNGTYSGELTATGANGLSSSTPFSVTVANVAPAVDAGPDATADWGRSVAFAGAATDPGVADQATLQYSWDFGDGSPGASGSPDAVHAYGTPGAHGYYDATLTVCDKDSACTSDVRRVLVTKRDTTTGYVGDTAGTYDTPAALGASLVDEYGQNVSGRTIGFQIGTDGPFNALTNSGGIATRSYTPTVAAGSYAGSSSFAGDALYNGSTAASSFAVAAQATTMTYTGDLSSHPNKTIELSAVLVDATGNPLAGKAITFQLGAQSASATTDALGVASTTLRLSQHNGAYPVSATWTPSASDAPFYLGSTQSAAFKLQVK
jgi:PKD repeat protein